MDLYTGKTQCKNVVSILRFFSTFSSQDPFSHLSDFSMLIFCAAAVLFPFFRKKRIQSCIEVRNTYIIQKYSLRWYTQVHIVSGRRRNCLVICVYVEIKYWLTDSEKKTANAWGTISFKIAHFETSNWFHVKYVWVAENCLNFHIVRCKTLTENVHIYQIRQDIFMDTYHEK